MSSPELSTLELKYCERCGGLWLRPSAARAVYCPGCTRRLRELPPAAGLVAGRPAGPSADGWGPRCDRPPASWVPAAENPIDGQSEATRCLP